MKRLQYHGLLSLVGITLAGIAANSSPAQVFSSNGRSGVYVQGNGQGMAGTFDEDGFHGIAVGPDGRVRRFEGHQPNPFLKDRREGIGGVGMLSGSGAFAGAMTGRAAIGPGGFDPFAFVFGNAAPIAGAGTGAFAGAAAQQDPAAARQAFREGRYADAVEIVAQTAVGGVVDIEAEQMKALALFAMQKYEQAAASAYTVLKADAAWDWTMLRQMYPSREMYVQQLRTLQASAGQPTASAGVHFLLAYHWLMLDQVDAARAELIKTRQLQPDNQLVGDLLASLPPAVVEP